MRVYKVDPIADRRWESFLQKKRGASIFHTPEWLTALRDTHGYEPLVLTTSSPTAEITNGVVFCKISSWFWGNRLVSLPFSDHCTPLLEGPQDLASVLSYSQQNLGGENWDSFEIRSEAGTLPETLQKAKFFVLHKLDLRPSLNVLFQNLHDDCVKRKIRRAGREGLTYEKGRTDSLLAKFYILLVQTRRRHGLPPQPLAWFRNLITCLGPKLKIRVASKNGDPVASILTIRYKDVLVYKYGCSDQNFKRLGGLQLLLWRAIEEAKQDNLSELDMGRSDCDNLGLIAFKDRWGAARSTLVYQKYPAERHQRFWSPNPDIAKYVFAHMPDSWLVAAGRVLYKHMG
jgi:hypothetical protein